MIVKVLVALLALCFAVVRADLVGAPVHSDMKDPEVKKAIDFAVAEYNAKSRSLYTSQLVQVKESQIQVVAGVNYIFIVQMALTSCLKGAAKQKCGIVADSVFQCKFSVWSKPWENSMTLEENTC